MGSEMCIRDRDWKITKNKFDHDLTAFPLLGKHIKVECKKCHTTLEFSDAKVACVACHEKDDQHRQRLGTVCEPCHNALSWKRWAFDHDTQTRFKLDGAHAKVDCYACHRLPIKGRALLPMNCYSCHANDDVHSGNFGRSCERCHVTSDWKNVKERLDSALKQTPLAQALQPALPRLWSSAEPGAPWSPQAD